MTENIIGYTIVINGLILGWKLVTQGGLVPEDIWSPIMLVVNIPILFLLVKRVFSRLV